jgi:hypothetical protein
MFRVWGGLLVMMLVAGAASAQDGKLAQVHDEVSEPRPDHEPDDEDDDNFLGELLSELVCGLFTFDGESCEWTPEFVWFPPYPYADSYPGYLIVERVNDAGEVETVPDLARGWWSLRFAVEESNDFDGLNRVAGSLWLDTTSRLGLQTRWTWLHESLGCGCSDNALLGDANVTWRLLQHELFQAHAGLGFRMLTDPWDTHFGFNFTAGADVFPVKPLVLSGSMDVGTLGEATVWHFRGTAGVALRRCELYGGYDFLRIGSVNLQGPVVGMRFWF